MDHAVDVALWRREILPEQGQQEIGPACSLFEASTSIFSVILQILTADPVRFDSQSYGGLRNEFRKFFLWNEGFSTRTGDLDHTLARSKNLKGTVLGLMVQWVRTVSKIPAIMSDFDWSSTFSRFAELQMLTGKVEQIAKAAVSDLKSQYSVIDSVDLEDCSDSDSDLESSLSEYVFEDIIEDLSTYMESLADLSPSLEHPAADYVFIEEENTSLIDEFSTVSEFAIPFVLIIRDRFPSLDAGIVKRLGEANWQRRERLRMKLASAPEMEEEPITDDDDSSIGDTIVDPRPQVAEDQGTVLSTVRSSISVTRTFQSVTIESQFSEPSIFDDVSISIPAARRLRPAESVTSFATSVPEGMGLGQRRVPNLPEEHVYGSTFQCKICGEILTGIRHRADWKKHVYNDLEPYICLFAECDLGLHTFQSRREWMNHEFQVHRVNAEWHCNLCQEIFETHELFRRHVNDSHRNDITMDHVEEYTSVSKRRAPCEVGNEFCPFCLTIPAETQEGFASHVGKHQQEISLAALPRLEDYLDDESVDEGKYSDDDDDDDGENDDDDGEDSSQDSGRADKKNKDDFETKSEESLDRAGMSFTTSTPSDPVGAMPSMMGDGPFTKENNARPDTPPLIQAAMSKHVRPTSEPQLASPHSHSLSDGSQHSIITTWAPQNRLVYSVRDFEKMLGKCTDLWKFPPTSAEGSPVLGYLREEVSLLRMIGSDLISRSSNLDREDIETLIENLAICRTQLLRLQRVLESLTNHVHEPEKQAGRSRLRLREFFTRPQTSQKPELGKAQDILTELKAGRKSLESILTHPQGPSSNLSNSGALLPTLASTSGPRLLVSPTGTLQVGSPEGQQPTLPEPKEDPEGLQSSFHEDYKKYQSLFLEPTDSTSKKISHISYPDDLPQDQEPPKGLQPGIPIVREASGARSEGSFSIDRVSVAESLKGEFPLLNKNDEDDEYEEDNWVYSCKYCGEILEEGKAFELAGNRWHTNCFRCNTCGTLLDENANLLLLGDGSLICNNCTYSCSACGNKIEDLAILTGDEAFCANCFKCRNCKRKIENLRYARTSHGVFCMSCHESLMARRRKKTDKEKAKEFKETETASSSSAR